MCKRARCAVVVVGVLFGVWMRVCTHTYLVHLFHSYFISPALTMLMTNFCGCVCECIIALSHATTTTIAIMIVLLFTVCFDFILNSTVISNDRSENFSYPNQSETIAFAVSSMDYYYFVHSFFSFLLEIYSQFYGKHKRTAYDSIQYASSNQMTFDQFYGRTVFYAWFKIRKKKKEPRTNTRR